MSLIHIRLILCWSLLLIPVSRFAWAQSTGTITGTVTNSQGESVHHAAVLVVQTGKTVETNHDGEYRIDSVLPGTYDIFAEAASFTSQARLVTVIAGESIVVDLVVALSPVSDSVTVTARGRHQTTFEAVESVTSLDAFTVSEKMAVSVGEVLDGEMGVARRSFGPGNSRPIIRGFDGDRVLIVADGMRVGSLGSQSGDHGEPIDPTSLERALKGIEKAYLVCTPDERLVEREVAFIDAAKDAGVSHIVKCSAYMADVNGESQNLRSHGIIEQADGNGAPGSP